MCVFSSHVFLKSSLLDVPAGVTQEEGHTGILIHLPSAVHAFLFFSREGFSRSFPLSTVDELNFVFKEKSFVSKKNQNAPRPSEHPPVRGGNIKTF